MCDLQIVVQPPDDCEDMPLTSHVDQAPRVGCRPRLQAHRWGRPLACPRLNGGLWVWPFDDPEPAPLELEIGDAVVMHPQLPHSSGLNRTGSMRYALYVC